VTLGATTTGGGAAGATGRAAGTGADGTACLTDPTGDKRVASPIGSGGTGCRVRLDQTWNSAAVVTMATNQTMSRPRSLG
jgi:hypothetical protein